MTAAIRYLTTPDGLTPAQEQLFERLKARCRALDARLAEVIELCDEAMLHDALVYDGTVLRIREAAAGEGA